MHGFGCPNNESPRCSKNFIGLFEVADKELQLRRLHVAKSIPSANTLEFRPPTHICRAKTWCAKRGARRRGEERMEAEEEVDLRQ